MRQFIIIFSMFCLFLLQLSCAKIEYVQADLKPNISPTMTKTDAIEFLDDELRREIKTASGYIENHFEKKGGWRFEITPEGLSFRFSKEGESYGTFDTKMQACDKLLKIRFKDVNKIRIMQKTKDGLRQDLYQVDFLNLNEESAWILEEYDGLPLWRINKFTGIIYSTKWKDGKLYRVKPSFIVIHPAGEYRDTDADEFIPFKDVSSYSAKKIAEAIEVLRQE